MITFAVESYSSVIGELRPLLDDHYGEISNHARHGFPLNPQDREYRAREANGSLLMMIGRDSGQIVAYMVCFIAPGLHYADCLTCSPDIFYVRPDKRNSTAGVRLFRAVEKELKRRGVTLWFVGSKIQHDATALFRRMGFAPCEVTYSKWLEG